MQPRYDRAVEDLGNIVKLEHVNVRITDQRLSTLFYVAGLGFTRDPFIMVSTNNMWINMGTSQFHLPTGGPDVLRGVAGVVVPDRKALLDRLAKVKGELNGTKFSYAEKNDYVEATCPWGNRFRIHEPDEKLFGRAWATRKPGYCGLSLGLPCLPLACCGWSRALGQKRDRIVLIIEV